MKILIVGCGRTGAFLAQLLDESDHEVTIIDLERSAFAHLPKNFKGTTQLGNGTDLEVLRQAGVEGADALFTLTQGDNRNLMAAQVAKQIFGVKHVIAKVNDPIRATTYRKHGIATISRTTVIAMLLEAILVNDPEVGKVLLEKTKAREARMADAV
ncbi:MAG TPA: TrkA family potassium uptake protein [Candidatus Limnocylindrales bacterium]|nr:TrkA family potassium uptake protein [Candidatus Limnocylindrales bacterium]